MVVRTLLQSFRAVIVLTTLTGVLYPAGVMVAARVCFHDKSLGSRVHARSGQLIGSSLIGQPFSKPEYLWGRPSAAGNGYDATASGGTNVSPVGSDAITKITGERDRIKPLNPDAVGEPPLILVTASGSSLDPEISPEAARWQIPRIAKARGIDASRVLPILEDPEVCQGRTLGVLGEPRVNVLEFNLALDRLFPPSK